ncbi:MAG: TerC family protein [Ignavibacteriae bacterium]|nr:TerC family protein [Ignavibacteriota bacterium]
MLALDLGVFHKKAHAVSIKEATLWSVVWITLSLLFNIGLYFWVLSNTGSTDEATRISLEFLAGYLIEKSLSVDNIFVFILIFSYFGVPPQYQHKVLFWGVLGALIMRALFIWAGVVLISRFEWILYIFGAILFVSGWKMMFQKETEVHPEKNIFIKLAKRFFPVTTVFESQKFFIRKDGKLFITPMLLVLITVETTDVVFAVDSIPAVFGVTRDPFIVYSSNVFAILGLRALYFVLSGVMNTFYYLKHGLSLILVFIGVKMLIADFIHIPITISLLVIAAVLALSVGSSIIRRRRLTLKESAQEKQ